jgi:hypothetical protein
MMDENQRAVLRRQWLDEHRGRNFARRRFVSYPSLRAIEPSEDGWYVSEPYTGQEYDAEMFLVCVGGWDHEHCSVCNAHIEPGDDYWESDDPCRLELCLACHERLAESAA